jgi:hypothetical protein
VDFVKDLVSVKEYEAYTERLRVEQEKLKVERQEGKRKDLQVVRESPVFDSLQRTVQLAVRLRPTRMPHGTARAPHVRLCGQFTAHTARAVKKIEKKKNCPFSSLFFPCPR